MYRMLAREMAKSGNVRLITGNVLGNVSVYLEWVKWLSYESKFEMERIAYFESKKVSDLSISELDEFNRYKRNRQFAKLFKLYGTSECSLDDYMKVYDFMCRESIEQLMLSKLNEVELKEAKEKINRLINMPRNELNEKVQEWRKTDKYNGLSMVDSYMLHVISNIVYARNISNLNRELDAQLDRNEKIRQRTLYYASNPYMRK